MTDHEHALRYTAEEYIGPRSIVGFRPTHHFLAVRWHEHDFYELVVVVSGTGRHVSDRGPEPISRGTVILVPPGVGHGYVACQDVWVYNCFFRAELDELELIWVFRDRHLRRLFNPTGLARPKVDRARVVITLGEADVTRLLSILDSFALADRTELTRAGELAQLLVVLDLLATAGRTSKVDGVAQRDVPAVVTTALDILEQDLAFPWTLDELCGRLYVGPFHLTRLFGRWVGEPPMHYLQGRRLERAAALLAETDQPVAAVGAAVGLADPSQFSRRFRAAFDASPRAYRQRARDLPGMAEIARGTAIRAS